MATVATVASQSRLRDRNSFQRVQWVLHVVIAQLQFEKEIEKRFPVPFVSGRAPKVGFTLKIIKHSRDGVLFGTGLARYQNKVFRGGYMTARCVHSMSLEPLRIRKPGRNRYELVLNCQKLHDLVERYLYDRWADFYVERTK